MLFFPGLAVFPVGWGVPDWIVVFMGLRGLDWVVVPVRVSAVWKDVLGKSTVAWGVVPIGALLRGAIWALGLRLILISAGEALLATDGGTFAAT